GLEKLVEERTLELQREITGRKQAEETLHRISQAVIQSPTSVMITNVDGDIEYVNPAFTNVTGYSFEEVIGKNPRILNSGTHPREYYQALWNTLLSGKTWQADICNRRKSGELYWELQSISPIRNPQGVITHFVAVKVDQTERRLAEVQRLQLALEKEKVVLLRQFIGDISHDLKTPLTIFKTYLYLLERITDPSQYKEKLQVLISTTHHLERVIEDLLTMSRLDGSIDLTLALLNLHSLIYSVDAKMRSLARQKNIQIALELDNSVPPIMADESELERALLNLVENAVKYTPVDGTITIRTHNRDDAVVIEVCDTGQGIDQTDLPHIFERFYRADKARSKENGGTGLGLAIVQKVVDMHSGRVEAESAVGQGSTFRVYLPAIQEG
ncbi:MAG: PAS domain S-box protein, partial [Anaerolineae bacterium]|nr:PAS domain S-box protein [Anaerolineae bacterium]